MAAAAAPKSSPSTSNSAQPTPGALPEGGGTMLPAGGAPTNLSSTVLFHSGRLPVATHQRTPAGVPYVGSSRLLFRDRTPGSAGDLGGVMWLGNAGPLALYVSRDAGSTWHWVEPAKNVVVGTYPPQGLCQDRNGKVHLLGRADGGAGLEYSRIVLAHNAAGHITSFSPETNGSVIDRSGNIKWAHIIDGVDTNGKATLFYGLLIELNGNGNRVVVGRTLASAGLAPQTFADFGDLLGAPSVSAAAPATSIIDSGSYTAHNMDMGLAQNPTSKDLYVFSGVTNTGDMVTPTPGIQRWRYVPSGSNWAPSGGALQVSKDAQSTPSWGSATASEHYVWYTYFDPTLGITIKRIDGAGTETAVPSPEPGVPTPAWGWAALAVDASETKLWAIWLRIPLNSQGGYSIFSGFYNAKSWTTFNDTGAGYNDPWGLMGSVGWRGGLAVFSPDGAALPNAVTYPAFAYVIRGGN